MKQLKPDTTCIHAGYEPKNGEPRVVPIAQSTTYTYVIIHMNVPYPMYFCPKEK